MGNTHRNLRFDYEFLYGPTNLSNRDSQLRKDHRHVVALVEKKEYQQALLLCEDLIKKDSANCFPYVVVGDIHWIMGSFKDSLIYYNKATLKNPLSAEVWGRKANRFLQLCRFSEAIHCFENAAVVGLDNIIERYAISLLLSCRYDEALYILDRSAEIKPVNEKYHLIRARILIEMGRYNDAKESIYRILELDECHFEAYKAYALIFLYQRDYFQAVEILKKASSIKSSDEEVFGYLSLSYVHLGELTLAIDAMKRSTDIQAKNSLGLLAKGKIYYSRKKYKLCKDVIATLMERNGGNTKFYHVELHDLISSLSDLSDLKIGPEPNPHLKENILWNVAKNVNIISRKYRMSSGNELTKAKDKNVIKKHIEEVDDLLSLNIDMIEKEISELEVLEQQLYRLEHGM